MLPTPWNDGGYGYSLTGMVLGSPPTRRSGRVLLASAVALVLVAAACGGGSGGTAGGSTAAQSGGFLKIGSTGQIDSLNPWVAFNQDPYIIFQYEYPMLVNYDTKTLDFVGDLATSWSSNSDLTQWTFHLRSGTKWSDGQPMTATDVVWNFQIMYKYRNGPTANGYGLVYNMKSVTSPDPTTVVLNFSDPKPTLLASLDQTPMLPEHVWAKYATGDGKALKSYPNTPQNGQPVVGGGPFMMTAYTPNQTTTFKANPYWYGQKPSISGWGLQYFATGDAAVQALKTGEIDTLWDNSVPTSAVNALKTAGITVSITPSTSFHEWNFNSAPAATTYPELHDTAFRNAMANAVDYNSIVSTAWNGFGSPGSSIIPPASGNAAGTNMPWTDPSIKTPTFDLTLAGQELDQAGYKMGPNGYRIAPGQPCTYSTSPCSHLMQYQVIFAHAELGSGMSAFQIVQADLKKIGIGITAKVLNDNAAWTAETANHYTSMQMSWWDWYMNVDPDFALSVLTCKQLYVWVDQGNCNKQYDALYQAQGTATTTQQRVQDVYQAQQWVFQNKPFIVLNYDDNIVAWSPRWTGLVSSPLGEYNPLSKQTLIDIHPA
jgi:peptide/nickel transport system substrate-binding protein